MPSDPRSGWPACSAKRARTFGSLIPVQRLRGTTSSTPSSTLFEHFGHGVDPADLSDRQVAIILDLSSWNQLGDMANFIRQFPGERAAIDHHLSEDDLAATVFKDRPPKRPEYS